MKPDTIRVVTQPFYANGLRPNGARVLSVGTHLGLLDQDDRVVEVARMDAEGNPQETYIVSTPEFLRCTQALEVTLAERLVRRPKAS